MFWLPANINSQMYRVTKPSFWYKQLCICLWNHICESLYQRSSACVFRTVQPRSTPVCTLYQMLSFLLGLWHIVNCNTAFVDFVPVHQLQKSLIRPRTYILIYTRFICPIYKLCNQLQSLVPNCTDGYCYIINNDLKYIPNGI